MQSQSTNWGIGRYIYLNSYALFLLAVGGGILLFPGWIYSWWITLPQVIISYPFLKTGIDILSRWESKKREYRLLIERNKKEFNPSSFELYMGAPCGRLLVKTVLKDLGYSDKYDSLKIYKRTICYFIREDLCNKRQKVVVYTLNDNISKTSSTNQEVTDNE
jgi:hypothetical protein